MQEGTYSVSALCDELRALLQHAYPSVWVAGEVNRVRLSRRGHCYFELIEKGLGDEIVGKLEAVSWRTDYQSIRASLTATGQEIAEGQEIRCRGAVDFYPPFGRLQFVVREVDPVFSLGLMARRRQETLAALAAAGLLEKNRRLTLSEVPLRVGLVTSHESAAYHDFLSTLRESGYAFRVLFVHAAVQGRAAEREVVAALTWLDRAEIDCAALIRGGGSRADLAVFDSRAIADAISSLQVPVLTGLGHEIDESIADLTAHTALKTPTKAAEFLVERVTATDRRVAEARQLLVRRSRDLLRHGRQSLGRAERGLTIVRYRLGGARARLGQLARVLPHVAGRSVRHGDRHLGELRSRLAVAAPRQLRRERQHPWQLAERIAAGGRGRLREVAAALTGWERLCTELSLQRTIERGFSITRDARGRALKNPEEVGPGDRIVSQLAGGRLHSRVEGP